jgi:hypothetical protein
VPVAAGTAQGQNPAGDQIPIEGGGDDRPDPSPPDPLPHLASVADDRHDSALHVAARYGASAALSVLLSEFDRTESVAADKPDCQPSALEGLLLARNRTGYTPLHCAALANDPDCVKVLLAACPAAAHVTDKAGATAQQLAVRRGCAMAAAACSEAAVATTTAEGRSAGAALIVTSPDCLAHHTCEAPVVRGLSDVPPENVMRLKVHCPLFRWIVVLSCAQPCPRFSLQFFCPALWARSS